MLTSDTLLPAQAMQLVKLLDTHNVHALMYADDAMFYSEVSEHITRTETWARTFPEHQRPAFKHADPLGATACDVDKIWKFALIDSDIDKLINFTQVVEREIGLTCEWSWHDQVDIAQTGNSKGKRLSSVLSHRVYQ